MYSMKIDVSNAFNRVSRHAIMFIVRKHFPRLARWVEWCYGHDSILCYANWEILSREGVQQGDPLGPLLFSLVLHAVIKSIDTTCPNLILNKWYLDDGVIIGTSSELLKVMEILEKEGPESGLFINLGKFEVIYKTDNNDVTNNNSYYNYYYYNKVRNIFPEPIKLIHASVESGFDIVGAPIGTKTCCENHGRGA